MSRKKKKKKEKHNETKRNRAVISVYIWSVVSSDFKKNDIGWRNSKSKYRKEKNCVFSYLLFTQLVANRTHPYGILHEALSRLPEYQKMKYNVEDEIKQRDSEKNTHEQHERMKLLSVSVCAFVLNRKNDHAFRTCVCLYISFFLFGRGSIEYTHYQ